jgi:hypothetical protein
MIDTGEQRIVVQDWNSKADSSLFPQQSLVEGSAPVETLTLQSSISWRRI